MHKEPLVWDLVEWRQGDGRYRFEVARGGLHATLTAPGERSLTLPVVAWDGLLDALAAARKTKVRSDRNLPARAGARWAKVETDELIAAFRSGASVVKLAVAHNRTAAAIEAKLSELGMWDRVAQAPTTVARLQCGAPSPPPDWAPWPDDIPDQEKSRTSRAEVRALVHVDGVDINPARR